jgi:hypothetical protein
MSCPSATGRLGASREAWRPRDTACRNQAGCAERWHLSGAMEIDVSWIDEREVAKQTALDPRQSLTRLGFRRGLARTRRVCDSSTPTEMLSSIKRRYPCCLPSFARPYRSRQTPR